MSFAEKFKHPGTNVLHHYRLGDSATHVAYKPAGGVKFINFFISVYLGHATACVVNVRTANDAAGAGAVALTQDVPVWREGIRQTDAKALTIPDDWTTATNYTGVIQVPAELVPADKYIGVYLTAGNALNILYAVAIEDGYYNG